MLKLHVLWVVGFVALLIVCFVMFVPSKRARGIGFSFDGNSDQLHQTVVVATLDEPIPKGKNVVWSAALPLSWKLLCEDATHGPIYLDGAKELNERLNAAPDYTRDVPTEGLYTTFGTSDDVRERVLKRLGPRAERMVHSDSSADTYSFFASIQASIDFPHPYAPPKKPLAFVGSDGHYQSVSSFGLPSDAEGLMEEQRKQVQILYVGTDSVESTDYAIDLYADSRPNQVIVALMPRPTNLQSAIDYLNKKTAEYDHQLAEAKGHTGEIDRKIYEDDVLLVPDIRFKVFHQFKPLIGCKILNENSKWHVIIDAIEDIEFSLNKYGADFRSSAKIEVDSKPRELLFNRPFLVVMRKRGSTKPYFAMWVDNAELLKKM